MDTLQQSVNFSEFLTKENVFIILGIFCGFYEVLIRYVPTVKDYTIFGFLYRTADFFIKNKAKDTQEATFEIKKAPIFRKRK